MNLDFTNVSIPKLVGYVVGGVLALSLLVGTFYTVDQGEVAVVTRFGAVIDVSGPGLNTKIPWITKVHDMSVRTWAQEFKLPSYSHDQQAADIMVKVTYRAKSDATSIKDIYATYLNVESLSDRVVAPRVQQAVKTTFGQFTAMGVVQNRVKFNADVDTAVRGLIEGGIEGKACPIIIEAVVVQNIDFSDAYEHAVEERMKAEVEVARVAQNLERERKTAEIVVVQAKAVADSNLAKAKADAEATRIKGEAEAAAIRARSAALQSNPALVSLTLAEKWNGVLPTTMVPGASVPFLGVK